MTPWSAWFALPPDVRICRECNGKGGVILYHRTQLACGTVKNTYDGYERCKTCGGSGEVKAQ